MKTEPPNLLARLLYDFFTHYLVDQRGLSANTIQSYRDSLVLLLRFLATHKRREASALDLPDLEPQAVEAFLLHLEQERKSRTATRNVRLSAIHAFFHYVAAQRPDHLEQAQRILGIPFKRCGSPVIDYLEYDEIKQILGQIDQSTAKGRRDYALLATMFNTGCRVQEILDLRGRDLQLTKPYHLRLMGKGRKQRCCPVWPQTARLLRRLCEEKQIELGSENRVFQNCRGEPLTRFGVRHILKQCIERAQAAQPSLQAKHLHPHCVRHSTAVALLKSGVDLSTISQWLGHASIETTNRYASVDLDMKRQAIASISPLPDGQKNKTPWHHNKTVLEWLESL